MSLSGRITHVIGYIGLYCTVWDRICRYCIWVELPVQMRLCPIFVRNVGSPDIHECFRGLTGSQRTPGFGVSQELLFVEKNTSCFTKYLIYTSNFCCV